ncbi:hypothetical protein FRB95_010458 [Tulasnella sp. JGI-2019a]|nr:hypothetical protein FRB95_010458 [Tulasnella sp. JGI-2019a]
MATDQYPIKSQATEAMQPTEEEAIDYTENNTSKTAKEIVTDIGDRPEAERQQSPDTQNQDELILQYYVEDLRFHKKAMKNALFERFPRFGKHRILYIVRYLEYFGKDRNEIKNLGLPRKDEIEMAFNSWSQSYGVNESITEEEIANVIQFCKEHQRMAQVAIVHVLSTQLNVMPGPIKEVVENFR